MGIHRFYSWHWVVLGAYLATTPLLCFARGGHGGGGGGHMGGGHAGGGHIGGGHMGGGHFGGGHIGGGSSHFGGGHFNGGHMNGGHIGRGTTHFGGGGTHFNGGGIQHFNGGGVQHFGGGTIHQGGSQIRNFGGTQHVPQMHSNFSSQGHRIGTQGMGSQFHNGTFGGQTFRHGVNTQPSHQFHTGNNASRFGNGGQHLSIQPNHGVYGHNLGHGNNFSGGAGMAGRMQHGLTNQNFTHQHGVGNFTHSSGRPILQGSGAGNFGGNFSSHHIGYANHFAGQQFGNHQFASTGGLHHHGQNFHNGQNFAQFHGQHGHFGNNGSWGLNHHHGGINNGNWGSHYRNVVVNNNYYGWYHRPWLGYWGFGWGYPYYRSAFYWGLGSFYSPWWGYGGSGYGNYGYGGGYYGGYGAYYNPYCVYAPQIVYVSPLGANYYTQPLTLPLTSTTSSDSKRDAAFQLVEQGRQLFLNGDYRGALDKYDAAIPDLKDDPVVHELRALALFALGDYHESAATLNALLAVAPGMDWQSMRNQYSAVETYTSHLRALESFLRANPNDAAARFVLGYHYLVTNYPDAAAKQFQKVVELEPRDFVAKKLLETLTNGKSPQKPEPFPSGVDANTPLQTDLIGTWLSKGEDGSQFTMTLKEDGSFNWNVTPPQGNPIQQSGKYTATPDRLILDSSGQQETLMARVESRGPNHFRFWITDDSSLAFHREGVNEPEPAAAAKPNDATSTAPSTPILPRQEEPIQLPTPDGSSEGPVSAVSPTNVNN